MQAHKAELLLVGDFVTFCARRHSQVGPSAANMFGATRETS